MLPSTSTFAINELLELILENASPRDVLLWQRVNKTWQATIQRSPLIQEKLFFKTRLCKDKHEHMSAVWNPFMDFFLEDEGPNACCQPFADDAFNGKADYPTATWKRMFVTNPAITYVELNNVKDSRTYFVWNKYIGDECGIMIGQLPEYLGKHQFGWILKPRCQCAANRDWSD